MSIHVVKTPDIGEGIAEVELVEWNVKPGDTVAADQVLASLMTDKAAVEVPSPVAGIVVATAGRPGDKLAVGSELLRIETEASVPSLPAVAPPSPAEPRDATSAAAAARQDVAVPRAAMRQVDAPAPAFVATSALDKPLASPSVRRHARELGVELTQVRGTGPDGRVLHDDVVRHAARAPGPPAAAPDATPPAAARRVMSPASPERYAQRDGERVVPVIGLRRQVALHMQAALRIAHFTYVEEIDVTELETLRVRLNERHAQVRGRLTLLPFLMRAIALAVIDFPQMNARYDDEKGVVTQYGAVHIGIATQTASGLMVPVVRHAEVRDLWGAAAEVARLADAARRGKVARDELLGSTITLTSLGPLGGIVTTPVINAPEVAIVGVNRIVERPVIRDGAIVPRKLMNLSSSFDHRVIDGQQAAEFVQALRGYLECPALLFVE